MKVVLQRVSKAHVEIENNIYSSIKKGMLVLFCVEKGDNDEKLNWIAKKITTLRIFEDEQGKMNKSINDINGEILVVSQFTLASDCKKGTRPGFDRAEQPEIAKARYEQLIELLKQENLTVKTGVFAANMQISLINDGPVTFVLDK